MERPDEIMYDGPLTERIDESNRGRLGETYSPIQQMWQVNPEESEEIADTTGET